MALTFGIIRRYTHDETTGDITKASNYSLSMPGSRLLVARIQYYSTVAITTNPVTVWIGQQGNTTYDSKILGLGTNQWGIVTQTSTTYSTSSTVNTSVPTNLILEPDEQIWFQWTRAAEAGTMILVLQGMAVS